jgi:hypothetical protein
MLDLDLPPEISARIEAAQAAGTFPQSLHDDDLRAIVHAHDTARASHDRP